VKKRIGVVLGESESDIEIDHLVNNKDAAVIKALTEAGVRGEYKLTPEQEQLLQNALYPESDDTFLDDINRLFKID